MTEEDFEFSDQHYNLTENEIRVEEQDLRLVKHVLSNRINALEFSSTYDENLFVGDIKPLMREVIWYVKNYREVPTTRILLDKTQDNPELQNNFSDLLEMVDRTEIDPVEFGYDLDKIKNKHTKGEMHQLRNILEEDKDLKYQLREAERILGRVKEVNSGRPKTYTQKTLKEYVPQFLAQYEEKLKNPEYGRGILTGYSFLDHVKNGLLPSELLLIGGESGGGKATKIDTPILTPQGFKLMQNIHPGDTVYGMNGKECKVVAESEIMNLPGWKFIFNDGTEITSNDEHLWLTFSKNERQKLHKRTDEFREKNRKYKSKKSKDYKEAFHLRNLGLKEPPKGTIRKTSEIVESLYVDNGKTRNHSIPLCSSLKIDKKEYVIHPYVLGAWLGDGNSGDGAITSMDEEIVQNIAKLGFEKYSVYQKKDGNKGKRYRFYGLRSLLRKINVFQNKHIPVEYLLGSEEQRLALLQGLMDTDGFAEKNGGLEFTNMNKKIIDGIVFLINSLGEKCSVLEGKAQVNGKVTGTKWRVNFSPSFQAFKLSRKLERQKNCKNHLNKFRFIVSAERTEKTLMKCIQVDSEDHMYLVGRQLIPTHNSMLLNNMAIQMWQQKNGIHQLEDFQKGHNILYFSLEMPYDACARRTLSRVADVPSYALRDAKLNHDEYRRLKQALEFFQKYPYEFEIVDVPRGLNVEQIEARFEEAQSKYDPHVVATDYLGLLSDDSLEGDDWLKLGHIAGKLHEFGRVHNIVNLSAVQLNRAPQNKSKEAGDNIGLHRVGRSALIMHHANIALQIESRKDEYTFPDFPLHVIKNRDGELGKCSLRKKLSHSSILDSDPPYRPKIVEGECAGPNDEEDVSAQLLQFIQEN